MIPTRRKLVGNIWVEEYVWSSRTVVFINDKAADETYDQAVARLERELGGK